MRKASCACGGGCPSCSEASGALKVSQPTDAAEIEADQLADTVMRMPVDQPAPSNRASQVSTDAPADPAHIQRKCNACDEEEKEEFVQRKEANVLADAPPETPPGSGEKPPPPVRSVISSGGAPLDHAARAFFEPRFGIDFAHVRVHDGQDAADSAKSLNARAYTVGSNIVFATGQYAPASDAGLHLIAHELAHVAQQPSAKALHRSSAGVLPKHLFSKNDGETVYRAADDLEEFFDSPSGGVGSEAVDGDPKGGGCPPVPTRLGDEVPEPSCPTATHIGTNEAERFNFCLDSDELTSPGDLTKLTNLVTSNHPKTRFIIHGYASPEGNVKYNFNLACHRANRIAEEMHAPIRAQVEARLKRQIPNADDQRIDTEVGTEIQARIETAAQGPTSAFGSAEQNRLAIVYAQIPGGEADEEPSCEDARRGIGDVEPELPLDLDTIDLTSMDGSDQLAHFHFCLDADVLAATKPADIREFAHAQASKATFVVHGFSSVEGNDEYNRRLSAHRALRVARELINAGVRPEQIREVSALGETNKFGDAEFNRVVIVFADAEVSELEDRKGTIQTREQKLETVDAARERILSGDYDLAADAYMSFWTCGRTRTVREAVDRLTIDVRRGNDVERRREEANGSEEGNGVNRVIVSNAALQADNSIECTMGRLIDMSFHQAVIGDSELSGLGPRHRSGLHLIHLAGLGECTGERTQPGVERGTVRVGIDRPLDRDPRETTPAPPCAEAPESTRLHFPTVGAKGRERPAFETVGTPQYIPSRGKLTTNFEPGSKNNSSILTTRPEKDIMTAQAEVQLSGDPATFSDYEVGFIQSVVADETQADYDSGHAVIQELPVPIRHAAMRGDIPVPAPWTTLDSPATPGSDGNVKIKTSGIGLESENAISLAALDARLSKNAILSTFEKSTRLAIWLVARRRGAPLDRFSVQFIDGVTYDVVQLGHLEHRHVKGQMFVGSGRRETLDPELGGEGEVAAYVGSFLAGNPSELPADPSQMRFHGAVSSDIRLRNQVKKITSPSRPGSTAMGRGELTTVVTDILDNLEVFDSKQEAVDKTGGKKSPRLGFDFIPLRITLPFMRSTGRLQLAEGDRIVTQIDGPGLGSFAAFHLAKALEFRIHHRGLEKEVIVQPSILSGGGEIGTVVINIPARPRDPNAPVEEEESDITKHPKILENMAEAWACTQLTKTAEFVMVGAREFARVFSMDRNKRITPHPSDRLQVGEEEQDGAFKTTMPCPDRPDAVILGSFHTHPITDPIPPVASPADMKYINDCGGAQQFIVTDNRLFRIRPDGSTTPVNVTLPPVQGCHDVNLEDAIKVKKKDDEE